jgi:hypothetical protein
MSAAAEPCPKCGYARQEVETVPATECPRCGVIYQKYREHQARFAANTRIETPEAPFEEEPPLRRRLWDALWEVPERTDPLVWWGSCAAWAGSLVWGMWFVLQRWNAISIGESFLHRVNLPFHEFGHVLFRPFGTWLMFLGGSLFQCVLPLILLGYFLRWQRQPFSASICLWWCGQNFIDIAPYIGDATVMALPLVGEWSDEVASIRDLRHDWHNILAPLGWLRYDHTLGILAKGVGTTLFGLSWLWGAVLLKKQMERMD